MNAPSRIDYLAAAHERHNDDAYADAEADARDYGIAQDVLSGLWDEAVAGERALDDFHGYGSPREWLYHLDDDHLCARALALAFMGGDAKGMAEEAWGRACTALLDLIDKSATARDELVRRMKRARPAAFDDDGAVVFG